MEIRFTWRPEKARLNARRHNVTFKTAEEVFDDPFLLVVEDCEDDRGEMRYHAIGRTASQTLLVVVHVDRSNDEETIIHIISARKAEAPEELVYADQFI